MFAQCAMMVQAMSLKGCMEHETNEGVENDNRQQFYLTLLVLLLVALCNWVYNNWSELVVRFGPRGRKRRRSERDEEEPEPETDRRVVGNQNIELGSSSTAEPMTSTGHVEPRPPLFPPLPIEPPERRAPWSPEWFTYWMLGRVQRGIERRAGRMTEQERKKYEKRREILRSTLMILEQRPGEMARRRAHQFCKSMTDLSVGEDSPQGPDVPELPEPGAEQPTEMMESLVNNVDEDDGYLARVVFPEEAWKFQARRRRLWLDLIEMKARITRVRFQTLKVRIQELHDTFTAPWMRCRIRRCG